MQDFRKELNRNMLMAWTVIAAVLVVSYFGETLKGERTLCYYVVFLTVTLIPLGLCALLYKIDWKRSRFPIFAAIGYFVMYTFVLFTGRTSMVYTYILPLLSFFIMLHEPKVVVGLGAATLAVNALSISHRVMAGEITVQNSRDVEIQIALLLLCFLGTYVSSRLFERIIRRNEDYMNTVIRQAEMILSQQKDVQIMSSLAREDVLTGVGNRLFFEERMKELSAGQGNTGVIYCDINGLKYQNDHEGHDAGDALLRNFGDLMRFHFRGSDCFRISGDEFVVLMPGIGKEAFEGRAGRFRNAAWKKEPPMAAVGWSYGPDPAEAVKNAEAMMYRDKQRFYDQFPKYKR